MRKRLLVLVPFVLVLYIAPVILLPSSMPLPVAVNQNRATLAAGENWLSGWQYRKQVNITGATGAGTDYQVVIALEYNAHMQTDFDDVRFTDKNGSFLLDYWRESYTASTTAKFWVEVNDSLEVSATIYLYYGNPTCDTASNGTATFPLFEDWASETIGDQWTIGTDYGTYSFSSSGATHGSIIKVEGGTSTVKEEIYSNDAWGHLYSLRMRTLLEATAASAQITQIGLGDYGGSSGALLKSYQGANQFYVRDDDANTDIQTIVAANFDAWGIFDIHRDGTNAYLYRDGDLQATGSCAPDELGMNVDIYCRDTEYDTYNDWLFVHKWLYGVAIDNVGDEESVSFLWHTVGTAYIWFTLVTADTFTVWLVLLGMIMVPASTLYFVKGGRDEMNADKVYIALIMFILGWVFIIGGIGP